ncbi:hypothetical protein AGMMS49965_25260 [Bacteroidia bacterium]|nr:hypothetical protein AGMMS49965_25260 [Bacteroidia bacterium]
MAIGNSQEAIATIPLLGMNRAQSADLAPAGSMDEQINLRSYNGSLVPILDSDQMRDKDGNVLEFLWDSEGNYDALEFIEKMYIHKTSSYTHYICVMFPSKNPDGTYTETQIYWRGDKSSSLPDKLLNGLTIIDDPDGTVRITLNGNIVIINWISTDDIGNKTPHKLFFIWKDESYVQIDLGNLDILYWLDSTYSGEDQDFTLEENYGNEDDVWNEEQCKRYFNALNSIINKSNTISLKEGFPLGFFTHTAVATLYDSSKIILCPIKLSNPGSYSEFQPYLYYRRFFFSYLKLWFYWELCGK